MKRFTAALFLIQFVFAGCQPASSAETPKASAALPALSWEAGHPERKAWSEFVHGLIYQELFKSFDKAVDVQRICPNYRKATPDQKVALWSELISAITYYESGWSPVSRMKESVKAYKPDPITKLPVYSEGLLQLSYQDALGHSYCNKFDWKKDKPLHDVNPKDPRITILDPWKNLDCGMKILAHQIDKSGKIIRGPGLVYWAVLREGHPSLPKIQAMTKKLKFCQ